MPPSSHPPTCLRSVHGEPWGRGWGGLAAEPREGQGCAARTSPNFLPPPAQWCRPAQPLPRPEMTRLSRKPPSDF